MTQSNFATEQDRLNTQAQKLNGNKPSDQSSSPSGGSETPTQREENIASDTPRKTKNKTIPVTELFGPTVQGEGILTGAPTHFLRTGGCPLRCTWCDSMHSVLPEQVKEHAKYLTTAEILEAIEGLPYAPYITLTGGDPCMHKGLGDIIHTLNAQKMDVAVETQGTLFPDWLGECDVVTFSPKPPSSGNVVDIKDMLAFLDTYKGNIRTCVKVVVQSAEDIEYAMDVYHRVHPSTIEGFWFNIASYVPEPQQLAYPAQAASRALNLLGAYTQLVEVMLQQDVKWHNRTHFGCQQHVLLWPQATVGV